MGLEKSFETLQESSTHKLGQKLQETSLSKLVRDIKSLKNDTEIEILTSIIFAFTKASLIDRDFSEEEEKEIAKRISRFIKLKQETLDKLIHAAVKELGSSAGRNSDFVATPFIYLAKKSNHKTKIRLYRYLTEVVASDDEVTDEEEYLLKLAGQAFGLSDKEIREYLLATELKTTLEEEVPHDPEKDSFASGAEHPVIKIDFDT